MPTIEVTDWRAEQITEEAATLRARGAEPVITIRWLSRAELAQRERERIDELRRRAVCTMRLKG